MRRSRVARGGLKVEERAAEGGTRHET